MSDTLILLTLGLAVFAIVSYELKRRENQMRNSSADSDAVSGRDLIDDQTREVLGESAFITMTDRVAEIMRRHAGERCIAVSLTSGASAGSAAKELHHILPGAPLWLKPAVHDDINAVDVYSGGLRIGQLLLLDADAALEVINNANVTGSYVCEQNCYEYYDKVALRIIIFFTPEEAPAATHEELQTDATLIPLPASIADAPYKITLDNGEAPITLFQN